MKRNALLFLLTLLMSILSNTHAAIVQGPPHFQPSPPQQPPNQMYYYYIYEGEADVGAACGYYGHLNWMTYDITQTNSNSGILSERGEAEESGRAIYSCRLHYFNYEWADISDPSYPVLAAEPQYPGSTTTTSGSVPGQYSYTLTTGTYYEQDSDSCCGQIFHVNGTSVFYELTMIIEAGGTPPSLSVGTQAGMEYTYPGPIVNIVVDEDAEEVPLDTGKFKISRTGSTTNPLTVNISVSGTATAPPNSGYDYTVNGSASAFSSITFPSGVGTLLIDISPINDGIPEPVETVIFDIDTNSGSYIVGPNSAATMTIRD